MARAEVEHLASVVRVFDDGSSYGDLYRFAVVLRWSGPAECEVLGLSNHALKPSEFRAIRELLISLDVTRAWCRRYRNGLMEIHDLYRAKA